MSRYIHSDINLLRDSGAGAGGAHAPGPHSGKLYGCSGRCAPASPTPKPLATIFAAMYKNAVHNLIRLAVAVVAVGALTAHAQSVANAPKSDLQNSIQSLSVSSAQDGKLVLQVGLKNALAGLPLNFTINTPPRIAFDFANTTNELGKSVQEFGVGDLRSANIVQASNRTRLVVNLNQMLVYDTRIDGNNLLITLQAKPAEVAAAATGRVARFAEARPGAQKHSLRDIDFRRGKNGEGRVQVDLSDGGVGIDVRQQGKSLIVDFLRTSLPRNLQRKLDVTDFGTPIEGIDTFVHGDNVRMIIEPKGFWEHAAYQTDTRFIVEVKSVADDPDKLVKGKQIGYSGEKLTLNFQNISTREALNVIADFTNLNIVISDSVSGNMTLRLKDVPWDQALEIILQSRSLDMRKNGNVIQVAPREELAKMEKANLAAKQEISELETMYTESFQLSYNKAEDVVQLLSQGDSGAAAAGASKVQSAGEGVGGGASVVMVNRGLAGGRLLSNRGSAVADKRTNTVFVQDTQTKLDQIRAIIKQIDVAVRQVMIEARFVEAGDSFGRTLGGRLGFSGPVAAGLVPTGLGFNAGIGTGNVSLPGASSGTGGLNIIFSSLVGKALDLELAASELDGKTKSIASPRVVTGNGGTATISQGVKFTYSDPTVANPSATKTVEAKLSLTVTPQITPDDNISMLLDITNDTAQPASAGTAPPIDTNTVKTQVLVENGGTVVIGGIYTQSETTSNTKVPLLGDIPILGWLFKSNVKTDKKKELLIFITPRILSDKLNLR